MVFEFTIFQNLYLSMSFSESIGFLNTRTGTVHTFMPNI